MFLFIVPCSSIFLVLPLSLGLLTMLPLLDFDLKGNLASHKKHTTFFGLQDLSLTERKFT